MYRNEASNSIGEERNRKSERKAMIYSAMTQVVKNWYYDNDDGDDDNDHNPPKPFKKNISYHEITHLFLFLSRENCANILVLTSKGTL